MQRQPAEPIRVFLLEDHVGGLEGLIALLGQTPEGDIIVAGGHDRNSPDLPECITKTQAEVVLADLVLKPGAPETEARRDHEAWGVNAIASLRRHSPSLKIVAYSNWAHLRNEALDAGADSFLSKAASGSDIRHMIRYVMGLVPSPPDDPDNLERITSLELFLSRRQFIIRGRRSTDPITLDAAPFAFLHYLALERQSKAQYWVERVRCPQANVSQYRMQEATLWEGVAQRHGVGAIFQAAKIDTANISQWATKIHNALRRWHDNTKKLSLICVPGGRRGRDERTYYTLHPGITSEGTIIHDR